MDSSSPPQNYISFMLFVFCFLFFLPLSKPVYFEIPSFSTDAANILYSGDATNSSTGDIQLNEINYKMRVGHAIYADPIQIWDSKSGKLSDFTTHFTFVIDTLNQSSGYGDALSFFLAPVGFQIPPNSAGEFLGLFNSTNNDLPQNQMLVVEFDSVANTNTGDPPYEHVGINLNSIHSVNQTPWNARLYSRETADAWLSYNATSHMLILNWQYGSVDDNQTNTKYNTRLSYKVDLRKKLSEWVTIGFSGTTGIAVERHIVQYWEFSSSLNTTVQNREGESSKWKLAVGLIVPLGAVLVGAILVYVILRKRQRKHALETPDTIPMTSDINDDDLERGAGPKRFSFRDLALATNNFSDDLKLGEGGFGCVYKGYLSREGIVVAVKKISQGSKQGKREYITEVKIISSLRHRNLVQLIGWCHDQTQFLLVYEFLPNASLDYYLFNKKSPLKWGVRYKIAMGLASALFYLHEECEQCVVHRDIKASNIMLDSGFNAKLGDFGLARFMDHELGIRTTGKAGTLGYMSPEYLRTGTASKESDVYSFGVVALEIACGRKVTERVDPNSDLRLLHWVWDLHGKDELLSGVDQMLCNEFDEKQVECLMRVGLWCAHPNSSLRPSISKAIQILKFEGALPNLPMKMPVSMFFAQLDGLEVSPANATYDHKKQR